MCEHLKQPFAIYTVAIQRCIYWRWFSYAKRGIFQLCQENRRRTVRLLWNAPVNPHLSPAIRLKTASELPLEQWNNVRGCRGKPWVKPVSGFTDSQHIHEKIHEFYIYSFTMFYQGATVLLTLHDPLWSIFFWQEANCFWYSLYEGPFLDDFFLNQLLWKYLVQELHPWKWTNVDPEMGPC